MSDLVQAVDSLLHSGDLHAQVGPLFYELLQWGAGSGQRQVIRSSQLPAELSAVQVAQLGGIPVFQVHWPLPTLPLVIHRRAVQADLAPIALHHVVCYVTSDGQQAAFVFARQRSGGKIELRTLPFERSTPARTTVEQLALLFWSFADLDHGGPSMTDVLDRLNQAFDVESVTQKFFKTYTEIFEFTRTQVQGLAPAAAHVFTQKLFNRLMFLAFLERKGWLDFHGQTRYLQALWQHYLAQAGPDSDSTFYAQRLKLLFFSGLNAPHDVNINFRSDDQSVLRSLIGAVPYLNGGLFEPEADDHDSAVVVPDAVFEVALPKLFYRYNFTVTESTPFDVEVAVDPEMLGKIFEELVTDRHESGSYYTPKPIVSFMCREALKGFLKQQVPSETPAAIDRFVDQQNAESLRLHEEILAALQQVKVCDPACGSGAYLLGMLQELLELRAALFAVRRLDHERTYERKLEIIQRNIYGVDSDAFAVSIARLRLWLSLMVEYVGQHPKPLPNLDYKIEVGDSLATPNPQAINVQPMRQILVEQLRTAKSAFLGYHEGEKRAKRQAIAQLEQQIRELTDGIDPEAHFDWALNFAEIFPHGFDIIIANPPYIRQELIKDLKPQLKKLFPDVYDGIADLYTYFYTRAFELLNPGGMLAFISPNKWFRAGYGANLRRYVAQHGQILSITDFGELPVFQSAATSPMIFIARKQHVEQQQPLFTQVPSLAEPYPDVLELTTTLGQALPTDAIQASEWRLVDQQTATILRKMEQTSVPLGEYVQGKFYRGVLTGFNKAFIIDGATRQRLIAQDPASAEIIKPLVKGDDVRKWHLRDKDRWLILTQVGINIQAYPAIFKHLQTYQPQLEKRYDKGKYWWELRSCAYYHEFEKPKIIYPEIAKESRFTLDDHCTYTNNKAFIIPYRDLYLLGVLNSKLMWMYISKTFPIIGNADDGGRLELRSSFMVNIPIPQAAEPERQAIAERVERCLALRGEGDEVAQLEAEIDEQVAWLYGLST